MLFRRSRGCKSCHNNVPSLFRSLPAGYFSRRRSGLDLLPRLKRTHPSCRIAVHSMFAGLDYLQQALRGGASGYFTKQSTPEVLIDGLSLISRGEFFFDSYITELMLPEFTSHAANIIETRHEEYDFLSHREQEFFACWRKATRTAPLPRCCI